MSHLRYLLATISIPDRPESTTWPYMSVRRPLTPYIQVTHTMSKHIKQFGVDLRKAYVKTMQTDCNCSRTFPQVAAGGPSSVTSLGLVLKSQVCILQTISRTCGMYAVVLGFIFNRRVCVRFKLIPTVLEGNFIVRAAMPAALPCILVSDAVNVGVILPC